MGKDNRERRERKKRREGEKKGHHENGRRESIGDDDVIGRSVAVFQEMVKKWHIERIQRQNLRLQAVAKKRQRKVRNISTHSAGEFMDWYERVNNEILMEIARAIAQKIAAVGEPNVVDLLSGFGIVPSALCHAGAVDKITLVDSNEDGHFPKTVRNMWGRAGISDERAEYVKGLVGRDILHSVILPSAEIATIINSGLMIPPSNRPSFEKLADPNHKFVNGFPLEEIRQQCRGEVIGRGYLAKPSLPAVIANLAMAGVPRRVFIADRITKGNPVEEATKCLEGATDDGSTINDFLRRVATTILFEIVGVEAIGNKGTVLAELSIRKNLL